MYGDKNTIKDKLPPWWRYGDPLYYCEEDDTLWTSQKEVSIHWYDIRIKNIVNLLNKARNEVAGHLADMSSCKSMYPIDQKEVTLQYKRYEWLDKLHQEQRVFAEQKLAYNRAKKDVAEFEKTLKDYQTQRDSARKTMENKAQEAEKNKEK